MDWLLTFVALLLPVVPLFFFPGCVCCGAACGDGCTDFPSSATVTFTGFSNGPFCFVCSNYNATYIIGPPGVSGGTCGFARTATAEFCLGQSSVTISIVLSGGQTHVTINNTINIDAFPNHNTILWEDDLGAGPITCAGHGTVNVPMTSTHEQQCAHDGSDAVLTL